MPPFGLWSWPLTRLGTADEILSRIDQVEAEMSWDEKISKVVWRGTPHFNPLGNPRLRQNLLETVKGKEWADVEGTKDGKWLRMEDFCRYKYIVYTEVTGFVNKDRNILTDAGDNLFRTPAVSSSL